MYLYIHTDTPLCLFLRFPTGILIDLRFSEDTCFSQDRRLPWALLPITYDISRALQSQSSDIKNPLPNQAWLGDRLESLCIRIVCTYVDASSQETPDSIYWPSNFPRKKPRNSKMNFNNKKIYIEERLFFKATYWIISYLWCGSTSCANLKINLYHSHNRQRGSERKGS